MQRKRLFAFVTVLMAALVLIVHNILWSDNHPALSRFLERSSVTATPEYREETRFIRPSSIALSNSPKGKRRLQSRGSRRNSGYLVYLCDDKYKCSGFADRQRAIGGLYLLSILTNRKFGIIMNSPVPLTDFYEPNQEDWNIPLQELEGKTSTTIKCLSMNESRHENCSTGVTHIAFNQKYPQEVVYFRSRIEHLNGLVRSPRYENRIPSWAKFPNSGFGNIWLKLMRPSKLLRQELNNLLVILASDIFADDESWRDIPEMCPKTCAILRRDDEGEDMRDAYINKCIASVNNNSPSKMKKRRSVQPYSLGNMHVQDWQKACTEGAIPQQPVSAKEIRLLKDYDLLELNLLCVHVRLGTTLNMPYDTLRTTREDVLALWEFLEPSVATGRHVYFATDSKLIREEAKKRFGYFAHVNSEPIVHINRPLDGQDQWLGMKTALTDQLLLMTSCRTLVVTRSGFSRRAACVRFTLTDGNDGYETYYLHQERLEVVPHERLASCS